MRRAARIAGAVALGLIALVALVVGATLAFLQTGAGADLARRIALPRINAALAGNLAIDELRFRGDSLALGGIALHDPRGGLVARVDRVEVAYSPLALLRRRVVIRSIEIARPELYIVQDAQGSNLGRALAPRHPAPRAPAQPDRSKDAGGPGVDVELRRLSVSDGIVDFRSLVPGVERGARLTALDVRASARTSAAGATVEAAIDLDFDGGRLLARVDTPCAGCLRARLETLRLPGALLRGLVPGLALEGALVARGEATRSGQMVTGELRADAGGGWIEARGAFDLGTLRAQGPGVTVRARGIDLSRFSRAAPPSAIALDLDVVGGGPALDALDGSLTLVIPASRLDGHQLGPVRLTARAVKGRYEIADLHATLPGVEVTGHGSATTRAADLHLRLVAADLAAITRSLTPPHGRPPIALGGRGRLDVALVGPLASPSLRVAGQFPALRVGEQRARGLTLTAIVPDVRRPDAADLDLAAPLLAIGQQELRGIKVSVRAAAPRLTLSARTTGPFPLAITADGRRESAHALTLNELTLRYPEATWSLARPTHIRFDQARLAVEGFALRAAGQTIAADLLRTRRATRGRLVITGVDLARLPRALLPPRLALGGQLDVDAKLAGTAADPQVDARVVLAEGRVRGYRDLALRVDAHYARARASGQLSARGLGAAIDARFDAPVAWPPPPGGPIHVEVALPETDLGALMKALSTATGRPAPARLQGSARLAIHLDGAARSPTLGVEVSARELAVDDQVVGDVHLTIAGDGDRPTEAHLEIARVGGAGEAATKVAVKTPLSLRRLLHRAPTAEELQRTAVEVSGEVAHLPLAALAQLARYPSKVGGELSSRLALSGTMLDPRGQASVDVSGATTGRFPPTDARLELDLDPRSVEARLRVARRQHALLALIAHVGASPASLRTPAALVAAPIRVRAVLGPLTMERLGLPPETDRDAPRALKGRLHVDVAVDGSLRAPQLLAHVHAGDVRLDKTLLGAGQVTVVYGDGKATVDAQLTTANGGSLRAQATTRADLGYPAVTTLQPEELPLEVKLDGQRFDLQGLSGAAQGVRTVGGLIAAAATVRGTVGDPRVSGKVEWSNGALAITGLGEYRQIHLAVHGDEQNLTLDDLSLMSGSGRAHVTATAAHVPGKGYQVTVRSDVKSFPIYQEGQPLATATVSAEVKGTVSPLATRAAVEIHEARIELSDAKRKDLQSLSGPGDVVLVDDGKPLNRAQAKKLQALLAAQQRLHDRAADQDDGAAESESAPAAAAPPRARRGVRVTINAPRQLWVTGKDAYLELGLMPGFRVSITDETRIFGQVVVHRGRINVFGRRFDLKADSTLQFDGFPDRPELDVSAQYTNQAENVTVLWTAKGPIDHLAVTVSSPNRPDLTESQLYTLVITGHLQLGGGTSGSSTPSAQAASFLGGVLAAKLQKTLAKKLPLDVLTIDAGGEGLTGTQLEAGRYVTDKLYVGYVGRVGADPTRYQNRNAVHVEYQLSSRWGIDGEYGDVGTGSLDLLWKKSY
ncbi:MAG TPA: translocation/assembly module TamB domain-containing protein [Polyangia bacterium]|nr:translocation/assembly module TamB domain-containing protein [Polyangia bacterium]